MPLIFSQTLFRRKRPHPLVLHVLAQILLLFLSSSVQPQLQSPAPPPPSDAASIELKPGLSITRELSGNGTQAFNISLSANQFLQLSIDKGDLNLSLVIYGPGGQKLLEQASYYYEPLETSLVVESEGTYRLEARSLEQDQARRPFELKVSQTRRATAQDTTDSAAWSAVGEASRLRAEWKEASLRKAFERYTAAWLAWRSAGNSRNAIGALLKAAQVRFILGEYRQALDLYQKASAESSRAGDKQAEAAALSQIGRLHSYLGDNDEAQKFLQRGLDYYAQSGSGEQSRQIKQARAQALNNMVEVYYSKGDLLNASEHVGRSLKLFEEVGDRSGEARALLFTGYISATIGELETALARFNQALTLCRSAGDRACEGFSLTALGISHSLMRKEDAAITLHQEAMRIFRTIGDRQSEGITLNGVGQGYENLNEDDIALENYKQALKLFQTNGSLDFASAALYQIAGIYRSKGDSKQALAYYEQCIELSRKAKKTRTAAYALNEIASLYAAEGKSEKTLGQYQKLLSFYDSVGDRRGQAITLNNIGDFFRSRGKKQQALDFYRKALPFSERAAERGVEIATRYNIAREERDSGTIEAALADIEKSVQIIEALRTNIASPEFRSSYFAGVHKHYELYIELLMQLEQRRPGEGFAATALQVSESARARSLLEIMTEAGTDIRQGANPDLLKRERELQQLLNAEAQYQIELANSGKTRSEAEEVSSSFDRLRAEYQLLQSQLREQGSRYKTLTQPRLLSLGEIQAELRDGNTLLLEYALGDEKSYLWAVTSDSLKSYELPARATLEKGMREVYAALTARQPVKEEITPAEYQARVETADRSYYEKALNLSRMLLGPVAEQLGDKRLIIVPEGFLQYIPFDALPTPATPLDEEAASAGTGTNSEEPTLLIARHEIISLPSISTLAAIRREKSQASFTGHLVAVLADPVFNSDDERVQNGKVLRASAASQEPDTPPSQRAIRDFGDITGRGGIGRLKYTEQEAEAILAAAPRGTGMVAKGFEASRDTAMSPLLGQYQIVHFATHGFINSEHPELSGIVLTMIKSDGQPENGFLQLHDIYNMHLSSDLVVLSACDTGLGKEVKGEGLIGLTRGFMYAGSKSVVASLWKVDDTATAELMGYFYQAMLREGLPPAAALRSAKEALRRQKRWRAPYFWAGFVLQGEYNERIIVRNNSWAPTVIVILLVVIPILALLFIIRMRRRKVGPGLD